MTVPKSFKVKDSQNFYYKKIEKLIDPMDKDYQNLSRLFGYKC